MSRLVLIFVGLLGLRRGVKSVIHLLLSLELTLLGVTLLLLFRSFSMNEGSFYSFSLLAIAVAGAE
jgi:NADH:ubiquinone oxidoreductase subunit K